MVKTKVINIVGASSSGKTTIAKRLEKMGYNIIKSYTTRLPRYENEWGHRFIGEYSVHKHNDNIMINDITHTTLHYMHDMVAYFNEYNPEHHYFITDDQIAIGTVNVCLVDPKGALSIKEYYSDNPDVKVVTIFIQTDEDVRAERLANKLDDKTILKYNTDPKTILDVWNRLRPDREIFKLVKCDYVVNGNGKISHTLDRIDTILKSECLEGY